MSKNIKEGLNQAAITHETEHPFTQNRELSWLRFNRRVLEEAADESVPLLERLKFISIFSSNLDEFFMVRAGSLFDIDRISPDQLDNKTGLNARDQLVSIYRTVPGLIELKKQIYSDLSQRLKEAGIEDVPVNQLTPDESKLVNRYFKHNMLPILSPIIVGPHHPVPHIAGKRLHVAALLTEKKSKKGKGKAKDKSQSGLKDKDSSEKLSETVIGIIALPESIPPYIMLTPEGRYIRTENILLSMMPSLFAPYKVQESCVLCVTRNADISFDDEKFDDNEDDFRDQIAKLLKKRDSLSVVRLELNQSVSSTFMKVLTSMVKIDSTQVFVDACPLNMKYVFGLIGDLDKERIRQLLYAPYTPRIAEDISREQSMLEQIRNKDKLLFYPYDSVEPFIKLLGEAADNPDVLSIKITIYRLASSSKIAQILCRAAQNGKDVLVLMELRARFDEANNITWSEMLEDSGCQVIYGMEGFKCHSKICLITMRDNGRLSYITQVGTGNYNEKTNTMYTDLSLMTASEAIGEDAVTFFRNLLVNNLDGSYKELCVSPYGIKDALCKNIDEQIELGADGYICIKANSVTELDVMNKLSEASRAGVRIELIIRGICCLLPGKAGYTDNISVSSIVGRYLEHARIYRFGKGSDAKYYIASADLMTRNLNRRVEIACPVHDPDIKNQLEQILTAQLNDTAKASIMLSDGVYCRKHSDKAFDSQNYFMEHSLHSLNPENADATGFVSASASASADTDTDTAAASAASMRNMQTAEAIRDKQAAAAKVQTITGKNAASNNQAAGKKSAADRRPAVSVHNRTSSGSSHSVLGGIAASLNAIGRMIRKH